MNRRYLIISLQAVLILVFLGLSFVQKAEAERQRKVAEANVVLAMSNAEPVRENASLVVNEKNRADSLHQELYKLLQSQRKEQGRDDRKVDTIAQRYPIQKKSPHETQQHHYSQHSVCNCNSRRGFRYHPKGGG